MTKKTHGRNKKNIKKTSTPFLLSAALFRPIISPLSSVVSLYYPNPLFIFPAAARLSAPLSPPRPLSASNVHASALLCTLSQGSPKREKDENMENPSKRCASLYLKRARTPPTTSLPQNQTRKTFPLCVVVQREKKRQKKTQNSEPPSFTQTGYCQAC